MPSSSDQTRVGRTLTLGGGAESSLEGRDIELSVSPKDIRTSPYDLCANRSDRRQSREGDRWFESTSLQRRVRLSPGAAFAGREPRLSARLCAAGLTTGSAETRRVLQDHANRRQYLCRAIFQYRSAADGVGENAMPVPIMSGGRRSLIVRWISALGPGSTKAQHDPLIVPGKRQA